MVLYRKGTESYCFVPLSDSSLSRVDQGMLGVQGGQHTGSSGLRSLVGMLALTN